MRKDFDRNETPKLTKIAKILFFSIQHIKLVFAINSNFNTEKQDYWEDLMISTIFLGSNFNGAPNRPKIEKFVIMTVYIDVMTSV